MVARLVAVIAICMAVAMSFSTPAAAAETKTGQDIVIRGAETIADDLYVVGRHAIIAGTIEGDLIGAVESIRITGTINGSVSLAARKIEITGTIQKAVRVTAAEVIIDGALVGDLVVAAGDVTVTEDGSIAGDLLVGNGNVVIEGPVAGDIRGSASEVSIDAAVGGSVRLSVDALTLTRNSTIGGNLRYASNTEATIDRRAVVTGGIERTSSLRSTGGPALFSALTSPLMRMLAGLVTGLLLLTILPKPVIATADTIRRQALNSVMTGVLSIVLWTILAVAMVFLVVGVPIAFIGTVMLLCTAYLSQVFVGLALGRLLLPDSWKVTSRGYNILAMAIGVILFSVVRALPFPYLSAGVGALIAILGIGGVLVAFMTSPEPPAPAEPATLSPF